MNDVYSKPNKASRKQQIKMQLTFLDDQLVATEKEKVSILADIVTLKVELKQYE